MTRTAFAILAMFSHKCDAAKSSTGRAICLLSNVHLFSFDFILVQFFLSPTKMTSRARSRPPMRGNAIVPADTDLSTIRGEKITKEKITG